MTRLDLRTRQTRFLTQPDAKIISVGLTETQHTGFLTREALVPGAEYIVSDVTEFLKALLSCLNVIDPASVEARRQKLQARHAELRENARRAAADAATLKPIDPLYLAAALWDAVKDGAWQLASGVLKDYPRKLWDFQDEFSYLGRSGGEGLGYGLPASLGAALAQYGSDVLVVDIQPDGDLLYTPGALWTAAHHRLPLLIVVYNNRTYGKDELHQSEIAHARGRTLDKVPIGIHIDHPAVDFAGLARAQGVEGIGPIEDPEALPGILRQAAETVRNERRPVLIDVICRR
jgi:benzoylformate decarboxylase/acetolactate synthase-1/2/3 large subunit